MSERVAFDRETRLLLIALRDDGLTALRKALRFPLSESTVAVCDGRNGGLVRIEINVPPTRDPAESFLGFLDSRELAEGAPTS